MSITKFFKVMLLLPAAVLSLTIFFADGCGGKKDAVATAEEFIGYYAGGEFESCYDMLASSSDEKQSGWTADYYARSATSTYGGPYEVSNLNFKPSGHKGNEVSYAVTGSLTPVHGGQDMVMGCEISVIGEDDAWLVSYMDWAAVPESSVPVGM
jgi:hypothetical protein